MKLPKSSSGPGGATSASGTASPAPLVAIIGRPNVGKSTLFNRLVGRKLALVDDRPGVTRDRREGEARLGDLAFTVIDTAGLEEAAAASLTGRMRAQTKAAIEASDVVLMLVDARAGLLPADRDIATLVRRSGKKVAAHRQQGRKPSGRAGGLCGLRARPRRARSPSRPSMGLASAICTKRSRAAAGAPARADEDEDDCPRVRSARGATRRCGPSRSASTSDFARAEDPEAEARERGTLIPSRLLRIAIVGRPNAGKSTLINTMLGEERLLTGPEPGITRDAIGLDWNGAAAPSSSSTRRACASAPASRTSSRSSRPPTR